MTMLLMDGFGRYGQGEGVESPAVNAMLAGIWASIPNESELGVPVWGARTGSTSFNPPAAGAGGTARVVLPTAQGDFFIGFAYSVDNLPEVSGGTIISIQDSGNHLIADCTLLTTGAIDFATYPSGTRTVVGVTDGPVLGAQNWLPLQMQFDLTDSTFTLQASGTTILTFTEVDYASSAGSQATAAQFSLGNSSIIQYGFEPWYADLVVYNTSGTYNNAFLGDAQVLYLAADADVAPQGWTAHTFHAVSTGILDSRLVTTNCTTAGVYIGSTALTDLGSGDFTLEGFFRLNSLPTGTNKAVLFSKWDATDNLRSYQAYLGGSGLDDGALVFQYSVDGSTVVQTIAYPYVFETDTWYHIAIVRASGEDLLFVNGIQQGTPITDMATYLAGAAIATSVGVEMLGTGSAGDGVSNTQADMWADETRITVGVARYIANFDPPTAPFPRGSADADWADVPFIAGYDVGLVNESGDNLPMLPAFSGTGSRPPVQYNVPDGAFNYQTITGKPNGAGNADFDASFIEADLVPASGIFTFTAQPTLADTITVGTTDGSTPAVYTFATDMTTAFNVAIGATLADTISNIDAAINAGSGGGTDYGTGTTANNDVVASLLPGSQFEVSANVAGAAGNSIASTTTSASGAWGASTLAGGADIPTFSQFGVQRLPPETTVVFAAQIVSRQLKTSAGTDKTQMTFVGPTGSTEAGADNAITTSGNYYFDMFEEDPDTSAGITVSTIIGANIQVNRTE